MKKPLFERLGGLKGISELVDEAVEAHMNNPAICKRFLPYRDQPERLALIKEHSVAFFCAGSGGDVQYAGRDMITTHKGMNISPGEYMHTVDDILKTMEIKGLDAETKNEVLGILWSLKENIISQ